MIERQIVSDKLREVQIGEYVRTSLRNLGCSAVQMQKTPLGEKIILHVSRPGLIVGRKGQNIKKLTTDLKKMFHLENPQIEIAEIQNINLDAQIVAQTIATAMERFGSERFKGIAHKAMMDVLNAGAAGVEVVISGKIPSSRAKRWRFVQGYLKKSGDAAHESMSKAYATAELKTGTVGIQVRIIPSTVILPDKVKILEEVMPEKADIAPVEKQAEEKKKPKKPRTPKKKTPEKKETTPEQKTGEQQ